ncbi:putative protein disulfide-isomerase A6 [Histomonas meleagridis]|uniref:putative protein disulfide-isomerase A6 n=1 Tax=Histomonas meleagridis TaxID=135588 RepID=UPI00355AA380|nr:putative protein disulfide-isomerase A6 [Histomonas meleagridis]KAH0803926.1 putative protein disulfide-isomerase A6 [Histomonas meleagridis]
MFLTFLLFLRSPTITDLTDKTFFSFCNQEEKISIVHFYQKDCPACVDAEDTYEELSRMYWLEPRVEFGQIDCDHYNDICDSTGVFDRPSWLVWMPGKTHPQRYNRNIDTAIFEKWLRQQVGIWPTSMQNNLLYTNKTMVSQLMKKPTCLFAIIDIPRYNGSQDLHNSARALEKKVRKGARFIAIDKRENEELAKSLLGDENFGAFLFKKPQTIKYESTADSEEILKFLKSYKCGVSIRTPTPTPEPAEELEDVIDEETYSSSRKKPSQEFIEESTDNEDEEENDEEWMADEI